MQVIRSCSMTETELRAELATISSDRVWIDEMVAAMTMQDQIGNRDTPLPRLSSFGAAPRLCLTIAS